MPNPIGLMRERLTIQNSVETADAEGQPVTVWGTYATVWGRVESLSGLEAEAMQKIYAKVVERFTVRYRADMARWNKATDPTLDPLKMQVNWANSTWNIHDIQPDETKDFMALIVSRVA